MTADAGRLAGVWADLTELSETYTCYSSALATWAAVGMSDWAAAVDPGLRLGLVESGDLLWGFSHFPPELGATLGLARRWTDDPEGAADGILAESTRSGRVIVAGDGFNLPWHIAHGRRHVPHWFVIAATDDGPTVIDPFTCRNDLGRQEATLYRIRDEELASLAPAIPADDPVHALREAFALGSDDRPLAAASFHWLVQDGSPAPRGGAAGHQGPAAVQRLADHFRAHGSDPGAYRQSDDLWSIARHRAYTARRAVEAAALHGDDALHAWATEHAAPLAARWGHVAPLLMQAVLALEAGRTPTTSLPDVLTELAEREARAHDERSD